MKSSKTTKKLVRTAVIAAIYVTLTLVSAYTSYGNVQFRISEIMVLLAFVDPFYITGLTLGCFIANMFSPNGMLDIFLGTLATLISVIAISLTAKYIKNNKKALLIASLWPTIFNSLIVGWELNYLLHIPLILAAGGVAIGEFVVVTLIGLPVFKLIQRKYNKLTLAKDI
ncbi:QueT transporter family protein [Clostridium taeniosporum]|uniref:QueT transporter family protein n=1 Tax=Clostridium taeniosporum TaxID=394958 RepID=A0A1D7XKB5_9CLOT|nr:QueT transporter family protein [Clostridium taeniosporum]AOR23539.1 QueT transporter family protein [Clostridium taeniosporum]